MEAVVVTLRANKPAEERGKVLFINAVNEVAREQAQSFLRDSHQAKILNAYRGFTDIPGFAAVATTEQIAEKDYSLAIPLYVASGKSADDHEQVSVEDALSDWRRAAEESEKAMADVLAMLRAEVNT